MPFFMFWWDDENIEHLAQHGITPEEFEEVVLDPDEALISDGSSRLASRGWTSSGRQLFCVWDQIDEATIYPVTAYEIGK